jgi:pyrimidine-specific ribonucleoside hydrolase
MKHELVRALRILLTILPGILLAIACSAPSSPTPAAALPATAQVVPGSPTAAPSADPRTHVVIDTDMALDDVMAILYLLERPDIRIDAITVSGTGVAYCQAGTRHALGLVALVGANEIPVACGRETPLKGSNAFPEKWRKAANGSLGLEWTVTGQVSDRSAVELLTSTLEASPDRVVLITLGPLTNLAEALEAKPALAGKIRMTYVMGGALNVPGNVTDDPQGSANRTAEFNLYVDPYAANIVFRSGAPITLVPLDATNQAPIDRFFADAVKTDLATPAANAVRQLFEANPFLYQRGDYYWWDPLTAVIATDETISLFETLRVRVREEHGEETGRTLVTEDGAPLRVAMRVDHNKFEQIFLSTLNGGTKLKVERPAAGTTPPQSIQVTIESDQCTYDGPQRFALGDISIDWRVDKEHDKYGLAVVTLDEGKTFQDLDALVGDQQAPWIQPVGFWTLDPGGQQLVVAHVTRGPIYLVCFTADPIVKLKTLGPIQVQKE